LSALVAADNSSTGFNVVPFARYAA
jgi:hypothetical protein